MVVPTRERAEELLAAARLPDGILVHSSGVARVASEAARRVAAAGIPIDVDLVEVAAVLHDIDKLETRESPTHGVVGAARMVGLGYDELAMPIASHPVTALLDEERFPRGWPSVVLSVADRHVTQAFVTIDERIDNLVARYPQHRATLELARRPAHALEAELAELLEISVDELVAGLRAAWEAGAPT